VKRGQVLARTVAAIAATALLAAASRPIAPAYVYSMGGKFDRSFNQSLYDGAERLKRKVGSGWLCATVRDRP